MPIDNIVPGTTNGTAAATSVNAVIDHVNAASAWPDPGTPVMRTPTQENFTGGRVKVATATDPEDAIPLNQFTVLLPAALKTAQPASTPSIRALGTTATTAAAGNHTHGIATSTNPGFMSADDKAKLDALPAGGGGVTPTAAPTITIGDPVDDENVQASFDALIAALKTAGVLT